MLKTPPVSRRRKSIAKEPTISGDVSAPETPQSILKVRKILQRPSIPETNLSNTPEPTIPPFPLHRSLQKSTLKSQDKSIVSETGSMTPKMLRFDLPSRRFSVDEDNSIVATVSATSTAVTSSQARSKLQFDVTPPELEEEKEPERIAAPKRKFQEDDEEEEVSDCKVVQENEDIHRELNATAASDVS